MTEDSIFSLIENLPSSVKCHIVDFQDVKLKTGHKALRVILDKLLTEDEQKILTENPKIVGANLVGHHRYAPEIKRSYFYLLC